MTRLFGDIPANEAGWPNTPPGSGEAFPVGAIFLGYVGTDPATLLGYGTWVSIGAGRVLVGLDSGDPDFDTPGETGGAKTVAAAGSVDAPVFSGTPGSVDATSAGTPAGTNARSIVDPVGSGLVDSFPTTNVSAGTPSATFNPLTFTGTAAQATSATSGGTPAGTISWPAGVPTVAWPAGVPTHSGITATTSGDGATSSTVTGGGVQARNTTGHTHTVNITSQGTVAWPAGVPTTAWPAGVPTFAGTALGTHTHTITAAGTISAISCLFDALAPHGHTFGVQGIPVSAQVFTGTALGTHVHTFTPAGTNSAPAFAGSPTSVVQPYFVVYMWRRSA